VPLPVGRGFFYLYSIFLLYYSGTMNALHLAVHSLFVSIQGEGRFIGHPCVFLRLSGCNLSCTWCDAREAASEHPTELLTPPTAAERLSLPGIRDICITGGEPFLQEKPLCKMFTLLPRDHRVTIETNGSLPITPFLNRYPFLFFSVDWKTPSSGEQHSFDSSNLALIGDAGWIKFVVADRNDLDFVAAQAPEALRYGIEVFVSPVFEKGEHWFAEVASFVTHLSSRYPLRLQIQMHKVIGVP